MPDVSAVSVSPTWAVPPMAGVPVAGLLGLAACASCVSGSTASVAAPVSPSSLPASSVKVTVTLMALPMSSTTGVYVSSVAPDMSASSASHW